MKDGYNRNINYMRLSVTENCNLRCRYCTPEKTIAGVNSVLSNDELFEICEKAVSLGIEKIRITGGEPLIRHDIVDLCRRISSLSSLRQLAITTNGCLLSRYAHELKLSGVNRLNISLDTLNARKFKYITRNGDLVDVLNGIDSAQNEHFDDIKVNVVLIGGFNTDEIFDFVELTKDNDITVRFIELMPLGESSTWDDSKFVSCDIVLNEIKSLKRIAFDGVSEVYKICGYKGRVGLIRPLSNKFCDKCNKIRVTADGKIKTCLHSSDEYNLRGLHGEALSVAIQNAILCKPAEHSLLTSCFSETSRYMNQIGG